MNTTILHGNGSSKAPYWLHGFRNEEHTQFHKIIAIAEREGITRINVHSSGRYYEKRSDGWYITSATDICDKIHSLPPEGIKIG
jgi:hypothetical protein